MENKNKKAENSFVFDFINETFINQKSSENSNSNKKIAFFDIFDPIPINSGGDWYRFQLLSDLSINNEVTEYFTKIIDGKKGHVPQEINFKREFLNQKYLLNLKYSHKIELIRPDLLLDKSHIKKIKADVIFTLVECYHIARYVSKNNGNAPIIIVMHNVEWKYLKGIGSHFHIPMKFYENIVLGKGDAIISISSNDAKYAAQFADENKVFHIPPKTHLIFNSNGEKHHFGDDKLNLLFYGSLDRKQNIEAVKFIKYELIPLLKSQNMMNYIRINIFGSGMPPECLELDKDPDINFIGTVDDPSKYIRGADLVLVPLKNNAGIKIRILESVGCEKPVLATPEAVENIQEHFKENVFIQSTAKGFVEVINDFLNLKTS